MIKPHALTAASLMLACSLALAAPKGETPKDPLGSHNWSYMRKDLFPANARVVFDERVKVSAPLTAENPMNVPVSVDAAALPRVTEVLVFADLNPIARIVRFVPTGAHPGLGFRIKLQQSSPVRAAARTADGTWHVGGTWVNTTGGGCTLPSAIRLRIIHPEDTGLAAGIPAFYIQALDLADVQGKPLMHIEGFEPLSENPVFTVDIPAASASTGYQVSGRDNNGNAISATIEK